MTTTRWAPRMDLFPLRPISTTTPQRSPLRVLPTTPFTPEQEEFLASHYVPQSTYAENVQTMQQQLQRVMERLDTVEAQRNQVQQWSARAERHIVHAEAKITNLQKQLATQQDAMQKQQDVIQQQQQQLADTLLQQQQQSTVSTAQGGQDVQPSPLPPHTPTPEYAWRLQPAPGTDLPPPQATAEAKQLVQSLLESCHIPVTVASAEVKAHKAAASLPPPAGVAQSAPPTSTADTSSAAQGSTSGTTTVDSSTTPAVGGGTGTAAPARNPCVRFTVPDAAAHKRLLHALKRDSTTRKALDQAGMRIATWLPYTHHQQKALLWRRHKEALLAAQAAGKKIVYNQEYTEVSVVGEGTLHKLSVEDVALCAKRTAANH